MAAESAYPLPPPRKHKFHCYRFEGKVAVITAGTQGIGLAIAERLGNEGASVVISSRSDANVGVAVESLIASGIPKERIAACVCHVADGAHRRRLVELAVRRFGRIDILVNNAGVNPAVGEILDVTDSQYDKLFDVNVKAAFLLTREVAPLMAKNGGGVVIFNSSIGAFRTAPAITSYGMSKTALLALVKVLSMELAPLGIRVNSVVPGQIKTRMSQLMWDPANPRYETIHSSAQMSIGLYARMGIAEEVAASVAYLASADAAFVTGENHLVVGGVDCRL